MASLHGINFFLLLFITSFIGCHAASPTTISSPSLPPTTLPSTEEKEKIQKIVAFTEGITAIFEVFNSSEPVGKNLKKLLDGSRKCGLLLYEGLSIVGIGDLPEVQTLLLKIMDDFSLINSKMNFDMSYAISTAGSYYSIHSIENFFTQPLEYFMNTFFQMLKFRSSEDMYYFKQTCNKIDPFFILQAMNFTFKHKYLETYVVKTDYSDKMYLNLEIIYRIALKQALAMYPICKIFNDGLPEARKQRRYANFFVQLIQEVHKKFTYLNNERKKYYWNKEIITKLIKKHIVDSDDNYFVSNALHEDLYERYNSLGYNYHVGVSNAAQLGHNDTVLQCSTTECHYLYNFLGKDIYVIRPLKTKNNNYSTCQFLDQFENVDSSTLCPNDKNATESLVPLAKNITNECKGVAFSLVRNRLNYAGKDGSDKCQFVDHKCITEKQGFTLKCHNGIHIVFANYPVN